MQYLGKASDKLKKSLKELIDLGADRILTSGQKHKAIDGIVLLKELHQLANNKLIILPGSGINSTNILEFKKAGFKEVHTSASIQRNSSVFFDKTPQKASSFETIKELVKHIKSE